MLENFEAESILISEIEAIAQMDLRDIKCVFKDEDDYYETLDHNENYIWDTVQGKTLAEVRVDLDNGYTAIPF